MNSLPPKPRPKFFLGTSDDLDALHDQITQWLDSTNVVPGHFLFSSHFQAGSQPGEEKWFILVTVMYQQLPPRGSPIIVASPRFIPQPPAD